MNSSLSKGFTLIELLVVISIMSLLASLGLFQLASARQKANDAGKISEVQEVQKAVVLQKDSTGFVPRNYNCQGSFCSSGTGDRVAVEGTQAYDTSMQELVTAGYISSIPKSVDGTYIYYADATAQNAAFGAKMESPLTHSTKRSCSIIPSPYQNCWPTLSVPPGTQGVITFDQQGTADFCSKFGPSYCYRNYPDAPANNQFPNACPSYRFNPKALSCTAPTTDTTSCTLATDANAVCAGGGNDYCACI